MATRSEGSTFSCVAAKATAVSRSATSVAPATCSCTVIILGAGGGLFEVRCPIVARSPAASLFFGSGCFRCGTGLIDVFIRCAF